MRNTMQLYPNPRVIPYDSEASAVLNRAPFFAEMRRGTGINPSDIAIAAVDRHIVTSPNAAGTLLECVGVDPHKYRETLKDHIAYTSYHGGMKGVFPIQGPLATALAQVRRMVRAARGSMIETRDLFLGMLLYDIKTSKPLEVLASMRGCTQEDVAALILRTARIYAQADGCTAA